MTLLKSKGETPVLNSFISDFFDSTDGFWEPLRFNDKWLSKVPAANIKELEKEFKIEMAVPGMKKSDFKVTLEGDLLCISSEKEENKEERKEGFTRREFNYNGFSRSFTLPENAMSAEIKADYEDGVLKISIPKKATADQAKAVKQIKVS